MDSTRPILIGVSGGPDSLCLLDLLWRLGYALVVAHLNHGLRSEAADEALFVRELALAMELPFTSDTADVNAFAHDNALSVEEAARKVRYQFLFEQARQYQAQAVAVAHTADDQIETVLMHLLRGAGLSGLKGMGYRSQPNPWSGEIALVRPLLGVFRDEILSYCTERDLHPVFDRSNLDITFFRNRIRNELLPVLEAYNPNIKPTLWRMTQTLTSDDQVLEKITAQVWQDCCLEQGTGGVAVDIDNLLAQPLSIQRRLIRQAISSLRPGLRDIEFGTIEKALSLLNQPLHNAQCDLANGLRLLREGNRLWIAEWEGDLPVNDWPQLDTNPVQLAIPSSTNLLVGWRILVESVVDIQEAIKLAAGNTDPFRAWIDVKNNQSALSLRVPMPGDRFQPLGMDGHSVKLSDFFINVKMPSRARRNWPLVLCENEIAWISGYRIAHPHRLTSNTHQAVFLHLIQE